MLEKHAHVFAGWPMYVDHETEAERRSRGGLPRSVRDLGGVVLESHWDANVPAEGRFGAGAVVGRVRPIKQVGDLVELHPSLVESSINAMATAVRPVQAEGAKAWLVEGIKDKGSVDWVTEGGAGGKVVSLREAVDGTQEEREMELLDAMTDGEVRAWLLEARPAVLEAAKPADDTDDEGGDDADGAYKKEYDRLIGKGLPPKMAAAGAKRHCASMKEAKVGPADANPTPEGGDVATVTKEDIEEAVLQSPEVKDLINDIVEARVTDMLQSERQAIRAEAFTDAQRQIELRDLRDTAHGLIREAKLPEQFEKRALAKFAISDSGPSDALDVFEAVDDEGNIVTTAEAVLVEAVQGVIADSRELLGSVNPTRVRGAGAQAPAGDGGGEGGGEVKVDRVGTLTRELFEAANIDPDKAFESEHALRG